MSKNTGRGQLVFLIPQSREDSFTTLRRAYIRVHGVPFPHSDDYIWDILILWPRREERFSHIGDKEKRRQAKYQRRVEFLTILANHTDTVYHYAEIARWSAQKAARRDQDAMIEDAARRLDAPEHADVRYVLRQRHNMETDLTDDEIFEIMTRVAKSARTSEIIDQTMHWIIQTKKVRLVGMSDLQLNVPEPGETE